MTDAPDSLPGRDSDRLLGGKYRTEMLLGEGGFAGVYRARHVQIPSLRVAIKVLRPEHANNAEVVQRFYGEAQTAAALRNPHTVRIMDVGHTDDGRPYIVMEYVDGASLDRVLARCATLRPVSVARLSAGILRALDEAHALGIVHRDMKPGNVMVVKERGSAHPIARVLDFGIAKVAEDAALGLSASRSTMGGSIFCTPQYAAPEVLRGEASAASDVYALGHMMIEMLGGRTAYHRGSPFEIAARQLDAQPVPMPEGLDKTALGQVVARAVQKRVEDRWSSAAEMLDAVDAIWQQMQLRSTPRPRVTQPGAVVTTKRPATTATDTPPLPEATRPQTERPAGSPVTPALRPVDDEPVADDLPQSPRTIGMLARALEIEGAENDSEANVATQPFNAGLAAEARARALGRPQSARDDEPTAPREAVGEGRTTQRPLNELGADAVELRDAVVIDNGDGSVVFELRDPVRSARAPAGGPANPLTSTAAVASERALGTAGATAPQQRLVARGRAAEVSGAAPTVSLRGAALSDDHLATTPPQRSLAVPGVLAAVVAVAGAVALVATGSGGGRAVADPVGVAVAAASALVQTASTPAEGHRFTFASNVDGGTLFYRDEAVADLPIFDLFGPAERPIELRFRHPDYLGVTVTFDEPGAVTFRVPFSAAP